MKGGITVCLLEEVTVRHNLSELALWRIDNSKIDKDLYGGKPDGT